MTGVELRLDDDALDRLAELVAARLEAGARAGPEPWAGVEHAARHLACKPQRIYDLVHARAIPFRKDGTRSLFRLSALDDWLDGKPVADHGRPRRVDASTKRPGGAPTPPAMAQEETSPMHDESSRTGGVA